LPQDPLESAIEAALAPGTFVRYGGSWDFVAGLEESAAAIEKLVAKDAARAVRLLETFLAGCYLKAEEIDDSGGNLGMFVEDLFGRWMKARQAAGADPSETAKLLLARMDDDPYGFASHLEREAVKVMDKAALSAFEAQVRARLDGATTGAEGGYGRRRWGEILRAIYARRKNVAAYVALCEATDTAPQDCLAIATILRSRGKPTDALSWLDRGLVLARKHPHGSVADHDLVKMKRELLAKVGRVDDALEDAWAEFRAQPHTYSYRDLMSFVPKAKRAAWHEKAMEATERARGADLGSLIELWMETKEIERLVSRLRRAKDAELEDLSHYSTEPVAKRLAKSHPDVAAKVYRALGMRILNAKKSKYYDAALGNLENAQRCYQRAGLVKKWNAVIAEVRASHQRKAGFMSDFERLVTGHGPSDEPSFLERARARWSLARRG
jgi:tetratricopeptide (TPR) repeat protein